MVLFLFWALKDSENGALSEKMQEFLRKFEKSPDGKIDMSEVGRHALGRFPEKRIM